MSPNDKWILSEARCPMQPPPLGFVNVGESLRPEIPFGLAEHSEETSPQDLSSRAGSSLACDLRFVS
jgi:hypothetical protein